MKKIAFIAAVAAFGLAACTNDAAETNNATDLNATETEAGADAVENTVEDAAN